jgi:hypothetical protein
MSGAGAITTSGVTEPAVTTTGVTKAGVTILGVTQGGGITPPHSGPILALNLNMTAGTISMIVP